jgi:SAM-dependent methyltransferase
MHASSFENMQRCYARYVAPRYAQGQSQVWVLDVGGADVNGGYRSIFCRTDFSYVTADLAPGEGVDVVLSDPYKLPVESASFDIVISGQMLEHCEMFWLAFAEMVRVVKDDGFILLIAPSSGPIHQYPVDCYRFYPDAFKALAKYSNIALVDCWMDNRGPWHDLVGVFSKEPSSPLDGEKLWIETDPAVLALSAFDPRTSPSGTVSEEETTGEQHYVETLRHIHESLAPTRYLEIGVRDGNSLGVARCPAIGIDPKPLVDTSALGRHVIVDPVTSDEYFSRLIPKAFELLPSTGEKPNPRADFCFIDGMHLIEYVLRDFMHLEKLATPGAVIAIDDILPNHPAQATRMRRTRVWTGDVWKIVSIFSQLRPDLSILALNTVPTGMLLVTNLDPANRVLWEQYNPLVRQQRMDIDPPQAVLSRTHARSPHDPAVTSWLSEIATARGRGENADPATLRSLLTIKPDLRGDQ